MCVFALFFLFNCYNVVLAKCAPNIYGLLLKGQSRARLLYVCLRDVRGNNRKKVKSLASKRPLWAIEMLLSLWKKNIKKTQKQHQLMNLHLDPPNWRRAWSYINLINFLLRRRSLPNSTLWVTYFYVYFHNFVGP